MRLPTHIRRILLLIAGSVFLVLGVIGLALPFLQGFLFIIIGGVLLSLASRKVRDAIAERTKRYPRVHKFVQRTHEWLERYVEPAE